MSSRRRAALLKFAHAHGAVIIEDDYDAEFRFGGRPLDALQTLDRAESVFYVGTFSKSLFPALRLGFAVAPSWAQGALGAAKHYADWSCSPISQETLAAFINEGHLARHVRRMLRVYSSRRDVLLEGLRTELSPWLEPLSNVAGLHLAALAVAKSVDVARLVEKARELEVGVMSLEPFRVGKAGGSGLVLAMERWTRAVSLPASGGCGGPASKWLPEIPGDWTSWGANSRLRLDRHENLASHFVGGAHVGSRGFRGGDYACQHAKGGVGESPGRGRRLPLENGAGPGSVGRRAPGAGAGACGRAQPG